MKKSFFWENSQSENKNFILLFAQQFLRLQLFVVLTFVFISGCASNPKKPSSVATEVGQIRVVLSELRQAYENKNEDDFLSKLAPSSELHQSLKKLVPEDFARFSEADLSMTIEWIEIEEKMLLTAVRWKGVWTVNSAAAPFEKRGNTLFLWSPRKDPRLIKIRGSSPFSPFQLDLTD